MVLPLRPDQEAHLLKLCEEMGRTPEDFVREAVLTFMEDYEDGRAGQEALSQLQRGEIGTISLQDLMAKYGVDNKAGADSREANGQAGSASASTSLKVSDESAHAA